NRSRCALRACASNFITRAHRLPTAKRQAAISTASKVTPTRADRPRRNTGKYALDMHSHTLESWRQRHDFNRDTSLAERSTLGVVVLTAAMMIIEIVAGVYYGSMALLADGWHMATHVAAFGITLFAYRYARTHASDPRFSFGTGKVTTLGGFASA